MLALRAALIVAITFVMATYAFAAPKFPALTGRVVDQAGVLTPDQVVMLSNKLATYEQQSGHQVAIATVKSLEGLDIRDYGYQLGRVWALGQKGKNDGVLVLVAPTEHKTSIEVGYGLEGDLTDLASSLIIRRDMLPKFRNGDYVGGLWAGTDDIVKVVGGQGGEIVKAAQQQQAAKASQDGGSVPLLPLVIFIIVMLFIVVRASHGRGVYLPMGGGFGGGGGGGGGFSGGSDFSGGGGSFGGGGASGGW